MSQIRQINQSQQNEYQKNINLFQIIVNELLSDQEKKDILLDILYQLYVQDFHFFLQIFSKINKPLIMEIVLQDFQNHQRMQSLNITILMESWNINHDDFVYFLAFAQK